MPKHYNLAQQRLDNEEDNIPILSGNWDKNIYSVVYNNEGTYKRMFICASSFEEAMSLVKVVQTNDRELNEVNKVELVLSGDLIKDYETTLGIAGNNKNKCGGCPNKHTNNP